MILTGPDKEGVTKVTEDQVLEVLNAIENTKLDPYEDSAVAGSLMTTIPTKGSILDYKIDEQLGTKTLFLSNGATITYKKTDFKNDEILFDAFSYGGTSLYSDEELKETASANGGLFEAGVNGINKNDMTKMMSGKIASVRPYIGSKVEGMRGSLPHRI